MITFWGNPDFTLSRLPAYGTTSCMASIILPGNEEDYGKVMNCCQELNKIINKTGHGAVARGIHLEGPIITTRGGLPDFKELKSMKVAQFEKMLDDVGPHVKIITISPSAENSLHDKFGDPTYSRIKAMLRRGIVPSLGHDKECTEEDIMGCLTQENPHDIRFHLTHAFNVQ